MSEQLALFDVEAAPQGAAQPVTVPEPPAVVRELGDGLNNLPTGQRSTWTQWCGMAGYRGDRSGPAWEAYRAGWTGGEFNRGRRRRQREDGTRYWEDLEDLVAQVLGEAATAAIDEAEAERAAGGY